MAATVLTPKAAPPGRVDLAALLPAILAGQTAAAVERLRLGRLAVGDLFAVRAGDAAELVIDGGSALFDGVGAGMTAGALHLHGDAGAGLGQGMRGGTITVGGGTGPFAAAGMQGGTITIAGDAGDFLGGPPPAGRIGMAGGVVHVAGSAGARAGDRMRRGLIVIEGAAGAHAGSRMVAGTLVVCGAVGAAPGVLMRRGTLLLGAAPPALPGFAASCLAEDGTFLSLLARALRPLSPAAAALANAVRERLLGDLAGLGKGEILLAGRA